MSTFTPREIKYLALLSRTYLESYDDIQAAIRQGMEQNQTPQGRAGVGIHFGLSEAEFSKHLPENILRYRGTVADRAHLRDSDEVREDVLRHIGFGRLKPGDRFPARTAFTKTYLCSKKVHQDVVEQLLKEKIIHRPGGNGGPLYVR